MIINRDRHPDVTFLPSDQIRQVGTIGGTPLVLVGYEPGFEVDQKEPIVARAYSSDPQEEELFAVPLSELMNSQEAIALDGLES